MRILHLFLFSILLKNVYCESSDPLPKSKASPFEVPAINTKLGKVRPQAPPNPEVTAYQLAVQWPPGVCTGNSGVTCKINPVPTEFTIHGLWPQPNGAPSNETFNAQEIATLTTELNRNWPNLESAQQSVSVNLVFWRHEWTEHGKYSGLGVREYFEKSLLLLKDFGGLKAKLGAEKITPSIYNTYKLADIEAAVKKINDNFSATIICVQRQGSSNKQQIQEIRFKYTKDFRKQNNLRTSTCGPDILFPAPGFGLTEVVSMPEVHHHPL